MLRLLAVLFFIMQPLAASALCEGVDLIADLPEAERERIEARAAATPFPQGLLWRATRGDTEITLFGTYHFRHAQTEAHLDRLRPAIAAADTVYLEISPEDQQNYQNAIARDPSIMFITQGETLPDLLGEADWQAYKAEMEKRQIPSFMASRFKPLWAALMLGIGPCEVQYGAMQGGGIDELIGQEAQKTGTPDLSLEDFADVLAALDSEPMEKQLDMIRLTLAWPDDPDDMTYTIRERYLSEQVALTWEFSRLLSLKYGGATAAEDFARFERVLLTERNAAWVAKLMAEMPGQRILVAVGAMHLPGENGILRLLETEGFGIERLGL